MSTQKYTAVMTSLYKRVGEAIWTFFKNKNQGWGDRNPYTDALQSIYSKK